uniref:Homeobox domain-containing protein n=1 Tax=Panagrolaimus davidi TaxID=227884 RepID=A0A914QQY3_9BILA
MSRQRTQFSEVQTRVLEDTFKECHYPNTDTKKCLALKLDLPENRITVWFQNRRAKQRRHIKKEMGCHSSRKPITRPHTISITPKAELACDNENSSYSTWINTNNNNSTTNDWKLSNGNVPSFGAFSFTNTFNNYSGDGNSAFASNFGNYSFPSNEILSGNNNIGDSHASQSLPVDSFVPYSVPTQAYPDFINQEAMKMAFHSNSDGHVLSRKMSRQRTQFSEVQTRVLEDTFKECHYPNTDTKKCLALKLDLPENRITVWFQNRRAKQRRHIKKEMGCHSSRKPIIRPHTISITPKSELACDNENSSYSTWINTNNNNSTTNDWKLSNGNVPSFGAFSFTNTFNNYSGDGNSAFASNFGNYSFPSNEILSGNNNIGDSHASQSLPVDSFVPYSVPTQAYPDFINQEAMKMAFHSNSDGHVLSFC